jgi:hypothetical protein
MYFITLSFQLRTQISVLSGQNIPKSEFVVAVLQRTWQIVVCLSHLFVFLAYLN